MGMEPDDIQATTRNMMEWSKGMPYFSEFLVKLGDNSNLPAALIVNQTYVKKLKSNLVKVILMNTNDNNV